MSKYSKPIYSRPRTKVYNTNYNIGESYYKPALDRLDRKYGSSVPSAGFYTMPPPFERPPPQETSSRRSPFREIEDEFFGDRRKPLDFDPMFEGRTRNGIQKERTPIRGLRAFEQEIEDDMASSMRKLKVGKGARALMDEIEDDMMSVRSRRPKVNFSDKVMESVGITDRARSALEDEGISSRRMLKMTSSAGGDDFAKWTALKPRRGIEEDDGLMSSGAMERARKSRARLEDLESEMQALSEKSAAREKRVRDLKALVQENEASALDNIHSTVKVQSSIQSEKTVSF